ncbi:hypothetical protein [Streptomyces sp. NBC_01568]|uniref:hypothetical protein n=1 Tax=Streptomyces sp. NBC_01568 TaxID=2975882 RepID=UPI002F915A45
MSGIRIIECTSSTELHRHYSGQSESQNAYIELDLKEGSLLADFDSEVGDGVPFSVYHGFERRYAIPVLTGASANRLMADLAPLAERILADWEEHWDGSNMVARLGADAQEAEELIEERLGIHLPPQEQREQFDTEDLVAEWGLDGALNGCEVEEYGITADTTDGRLDEIAADIRANLAECGEGTVVVVHGLEDHLRQLRDGLTDADA